MLLYQKKMEKIKIRIKKKNKRNTQQQYKQKQQQHIIAPVSITGRDAIMLSLPLSDLHFQYF